MPGWLVGGPALAQRVHGIAVLVNDEPISNEDVQQRVRLLTVSGGRDGERLRKQAIDELIDEKLMFQEAKRLNIEVPEQRVQEAVGNLAARSQMSTQQFAQALSSVGVNINYFRKRLEAQIVWPLVIQRRYAGSVQVRQEEIDSALQRQEGPKVSTRYEYEMQGVLFIVPEGSSDAVRSAQRNKAARFVGEFRSCAETRRQLAGLQDVVINDNLPKRTSDTLPPSERAIFDKLAVNETTQPRNTSDGIELIAICAKREMQDDQMARREAEVSLLNQEFENLAKRHLHDLRRDAVIERR